MPIFIYLYMYGYVLPSQLGQINKSTVNYFFNKMIRFCFSSRQDHTIGEAQEYHNTDKNN